MAQTKIILTEEVVKVGPKYTVKKVAAGFARNLLIPQGKAILATDKELAKVEGLKAKEEKTKILKYELFKKGAAKFKDLMVTLSAKTNPEGHLYGAIHAEEITETLRAEHGLAIEPNWLSLKEPIKAIGEYNLKIKPDIKLDQMADGAKKEKALEVEIKIQVEAVK